MRWKMIFIPITILILVSCTAKNEVNIIKSEQETDYSQIQTEILEISVPSAPEFAESMNEKFLLESNEAVSGFDRDAALASEGLRNGEKSLFQTTQDIKYNKNDFISAVEEQYTYTGGAHGMSLRKSLNIDTILQQEINLKDLFSEEGYEQTLNRLIREKREHCPDEYSELWEEPIIKPEHQTNFYITDTDLVIYYQPYELSYYARGFIEFPLRLTELKGYMKEEYYRLVCENQS